MCIRDRYGGEANSYNGSRPLKGGSDQKYGKLILERPPTQEELAEARNGLRLLKEKMRKTSEQFNGDSDLVDDDKSAYSRKISNDVYTKDIYLTANNNYRKAFKPTETNNNTAYDEYNYEQSTADSSFRTKLDLLQKLNSKSSMANQIIKVSNFPQKTDFRVEDGGKSKVIEVRPNFSSGGYDDDEPYNSRKGAGNARNDGYTPTNNNQGGNKKQSAEISRKLPAQTGSKAAVGSSSSFHDAKSVSKSYQSNKYDAPSDDGDQDDDVELIPCPEGCGRSFKEESLAKHVKVCKKVFQTKRKKFDMTAQRIVDDDQYKYVQQTKQSEKKGSKNTSSNAKGDNRPVGNGKKASKWRLQSEQLRAGLRVAKGGNLTPQEELKLKQNEEALLVPCPYCGRKFNENAAERHIPFCQNKNKLDQMKTGGKAKNTPAPSNANTMTSRMGSSNYGTMNGTRKGKYQLHFL
eukprot:TRINITY_DN12730_c0_g2_i2.p1 TRINITY_DN12730_c0_g2~~TRINITY_DN12730_c0_g2_i2.p1  ORF type:complete len:486 (+),score=88.40 TRINITY_DN12730_c0_g2_i2:75-1460(+)